MVVLAYLSFAAAAISAPLLLVGAWALTRNAKTRDQGRHYLRWGALGALIGGIVAGGMYAALHEYPSGMMPGVGVAGAGYTLASGLAAVQWRWQMQRHAQERRQRRDA
jgi:hypothetical protein